MTRQDFTPLDRNSIFESLLFLLPEQWDWTSDLHKTVHVLVIAENNFRFYEIGNIRIVVYSSRDEPRAGHCVSSTRNEHHIDLQPIEILSPLLDISLNYRHRPKGVNVLKSEILHDFVVPMISFVQEFFTESVWIVAGRIVFELYRRLPLLTRCEIRIITVIKSLLTESLFNAVHVFDYVFR